jgi:hypothetical protein
MASQWLIKAHQLDENRRSGRSTGR